MPSKPRRLRVSVPVTDPDTMETTVYYTGDTPTPAHAKLITNPSVWEGAGEEDSTRPPIPPVGQFAAPERTADEPDGGDKPGDAPDADAGGGDLPDGDKPEG